MLGPARDLDPVAFAVLLAPKERATHTHIYNEINKAVAEKCTQGASATLVAANTVEKWFAGCMVRMHSRS